MLSLLRMSAAYVHGYTGCESQRLRDQSVILADLLHGDTHYEAGARVLEVGCGVGAQTRIIAQRNPQAHFTCIDISEESLAAAREATHRAGLQNVEFHRSDAYEWNKGGTRYDHAFFCFVLEHVKDPEGLLRHVAQQVRPRGTVIAIEGDHGSTFFHPHSPQAWRTIQCLIDLQASYGGDALIGRRLYPLMSAAGLAQVTVTPRAVYADPSRPEWVEYFTDRTYIAMVEGVRERAIAAGLISATAWEQGIGDLRKAKQGTFSYTFFKAIGHVEPA